MRQMEEDRLAHSGPEMDDHGRYIRIDSGATYPPDMAVLSGTIFADRVAFFRPKGPTQRRWRIFFRLTDPDGYNRKARRAHAWWQAQLDAAENRFECEGRQTRAYEALMNGEEIDIDDIIDALDGGGGDLPEAIQDAGYEGG